MDDVCEPESGESLLMCMPQSLLDIMPVEYYAWWTINCCGLINDAVFMIVVSYVGCGDIWYSLTHIYTFMKIFRIMVRCSL